MKFSSLSLVLVAAVTLTVGCAKKAQVPGGAPTVNANAPAKDGKQPTGTDEKIVEKLKEAGQEPRQSVSSALDGGWESNCVKSRLTLRPQEHVSDLYESYRYYITIADGALLEQLFYFKGDTCGSYEFSKEIGVGDIWFFDVTQQGAVNAAPFLVDYVGYNFEATGGIDGSIALKEQDGKQSIVFDDSTLVFTRDR